MGKREPPNIRPFRSKSLNFERKSNHWLELTRNWIIEANQAKNLALQENFSEMKNFLKKIGSNRRLAAGRLEIDFKKPFNFLANLPAEAKGEAPSEAANSIWWSILKIVRTHFAAKPQNEGTKN